MKKTKLCLSVQIYNDSENKIRFKIINNDVVFVSVAYKDIEECQAGVESFILSLKKRNYDFFSINHLGKRKVRIVFTNYENKKIGLSKVFKNIKQCYKEMAFLLDCNEILFKIKFIDKSKNYDLIIQKENGQNSYLYSLSNISFMSSPSGYSFIIFITIAIFYYFISPHKFKIVDIIIILLLIIMAIATYIYFKIKKNQ